MASKLSKKRRQEERQAHKMQEDDEEEEEEDEGEIRCICGFPDDDGFTIQCEKCLVWQHGACVNITAENVPDKYLCELCDPRWLDIEACHSNFFLSY